MKTIVLWIALGLYQFITVTTSSDSSPSQSTLSSSSYSASSFDSSSSFSSSHSSSSSFSSSYSSYSSSSSYPKSSSSSWSSYSSHPYSSASHHYHYSYKNDKNISAHFRPAVKRNDGDILPAIHQIWSETYANYPLCNYHQDTQNDVKDICYNEPIIHAVGLVVKNEKWPGLLCVKRVRNASLAQFFYAESSHDQKQKLIFKVEKPSTPTCSKYALYVEDSACIILVPWSDTTAIYDFGSNINATILTAELNFTSWNDTKVNRPSDTTPAGCNYTNFVDIFGKCKAECSCRLDYRTVTQVCGTNRPTNRIILWSYGNKVKLQRRGLTSISPDTFSHANRNVISIKLQWNRLSHLPYNLFYDHITSLVNLQLNHNNLNTLDVRLFTNLTQLKYLSMASNHLSTLPSRLFDDLLNLLVLQVSHNQLTVFPEGLFNNLFNLSVLYATDNFFTTVPTGFPNSMNDFILSNNRIISLYNNTFPFSEVRRISLDNNSISSLPKDLFSNTVF